MGSISGLERCTGEGNGNPLQHSCLENLMDRGVEGATVHEVAKSWTKLSTYTHRSDGKELGRYVVEENGLSLS